MSVSGEARFFFDQVTAGRMTVEEAREVIAIPADVRAIYEAASRANADLAVLCGHATSLRERISERFEDLLKRPVEQAAKAVRTIQRSGKRQVRLPVARENLILANTVAQDERTLSQSL